MGEFRMIRGLCLAGLAAFAAGDGRQNRLRAAQLGQFRRDVLCLAVQINMRAKLSRQRLFVGAARYRDGAKAHFRGELHAKMAKAADPEDRDKVARAGAALAQGVISRHARA